MPRFEGSNALLTGAASGIGRATAIRLASEGATVFAVDRDEAGLTETANAAAGTGRMLTHVADVTDEESVTAAVAAAGAQVGAVDALINVAGMQRASPIEGLSVEDLLQHYSVNLIGAALFCREVLRQMPDGGVIVNTTSTAATHGHPYQSAYSASKGALLAFSHSLAAEVVPRGIRVVAVSPGSVDTPLTNSAHVLPEGRDYSYFERVKSLLGRAEPEQIAATIAFAASSDASYLTGVEIRADGGSHM